MPIRSFLFVPADSERKLAKGLESGADALILDLEDSVAAANRPTARKLARDFLDAHGSAKIARYVRINPLASGLALDDLAATVAGKPDGILLPKCTPEDVTTADHYLSAFEAAAGSPVGTIRIVAIATETAEAVAARRSGFTGKMAIHPAQLATINEVFSTSAEEREWAERVIAAFAANPNAGALALDGKMIDKPHLVLARRLLGSLPE